MPTANSLHRWGVAFIWLQFSQISSGQAERKVWDQQRQHLEQSRAITKHEALKKCLECIEEEKQRWKDSPLSARGRQPPRCRSGVHVCSLWRRAQKQRGAGGGNSNHWIKPWWLHPQTQQNTTGNADCRAYFEKT